MLLFFMYMSIIRKLKHPFIWLSRFRNRCGYGVHSPFAFNFITNVIYERLPYYAYSTLPMQERELARHNKGKMFFRESRKVSRLLFRLVNMAQPHVIVHVGRRSSAAVYLQAAKTTATYLYAESFSEVSLNDEMLIDFLFVDVEAALLTPQVLDNLLSRHSSQSIYVFRGIGYGKEMKACWKKLQDDERTGITFDLYDLGIVFFDKKKLKQHYTVNF